MSLIPKPLTQTGRLENHGNLFLEPDANEANNITREEPSSVSLSNNAMNLFVGGQKTLVAEVSPLVPEGQERGLDFLRPHRGHRG